MAWLWHDMTQFRLTLASLDTPLSLLYTAELNVPLASNLPGFKPMTMTIGAFAGVKRRRGQENVRMPGGVLTGTCSLLLPVG